MPFTVRLTDQKKGFLVQEQETILDAALRQNFDIPHSCCEGICGSCEATIVDGFVTYQNTEHLAFDEAERALGKTLLCSAFPQSDLLIHVPGIGIPTVDTQLMTKDYQLISLNLIGTDIYQALLQPTQQALPYLAGQYIEVLLPDQDPKPFSVASAPNQAGLLELHIRCQKNNYYAQTLIASLQQQKKLTLRGPYGTCFYHPTPKMPVIMIAVGTGFAPMKAIVENMFAEGGPEKISIFWAGKSTDDLYDSKRVEQWACEKTQVHFIPILANNTAPSDWQGHEGDILRIVTEHHPNLTEHHIYLGGPMQLSIDALEILPQHGAQTCFMYSDFFDL